MLRQKCRLGCLKVFGDGESNLGQVVGVALWPGICRKLESRTCQISEAD